MLSSQLALSHFLHYPQANWALLVLIPWVPGFVYILGPVGLSKELSCEAGSFSHHCNPHRFFQSEVLRLLLLCAGALGCVVCFAPQFLPADLYAKVGPPCLPGAATAPALVLQPPPCHESSPPSCLSLLLLLVWMNVSLIPWLSDFHTVQFSGSSGCFFVFKCVVVLLLVVGQGKVYLPILPSWPEVLNSCILKII